MYLFIVYSAIVVFCVIAFLAQWNSGLALGLMWAMFSFEQVVMQGNNYFLQRASWINIGITLITASAVLTSLLRGRFREFKMPLHYLPVIGLFGLAFMSRYWSVSKEITDEQIWKYTPYMFAFILIAPLCVQDVGQVNRAISVTIWFGAIVLIAVAFGPFGYRGMVLDQVFGINKKIEGNPLAIADYAGVVTICAVFMLYGRRSGFFGGLLKIGVTCLALYCIVRSGSRGQLLAAAGTCFLWLPITARLALKKSTAVALIVGILVTVLGILFVEYSQLSDRWRWEKLIEAREGRTQMAIDLLYYWANSGVSAWLFGVGLSSSFPIVGFYPHNTPAEVLGEEGLIGLGLFSLFVYMVISDALKILKSKTIDSNVRLVAGILVSLFTFALVLSLKQGSLLSGTDIFCYGLSLGWLRLSLDNQLRMGLPARNTSGVNRLNFRRPVRVKGQPGLQRPAGN